MSKTLIMTGFLAVAAAAAWTTQLTAQSQPVRESLRRTGEVAAEGTKAAISGTRNTVGRAADATRNAVDNTTEAARARIDRDQRNEVQISPDASVDGYNDINAGTQVGGNQIQGDASLNTDRNQIEGDSQFNNQAINSVDQYESGYRGVDKGSLPPEPGMNNIQHSGQVEYNGRAYALRHDFQGREFICVCGRPVYFDSGEQGQQTRDAYKMPAESRNQDRMSSDYRPQSGYGPVPAPPAPIRTDAADVNPAGPTLNTEAESSADLRSDAELNTEADADINTSSSSSSEANQEAREDQDEAERTDIEAGSTN
jgi:hypothetical protein